MRFVLAVSLLALLAACGSRPPSPAPARPSATTPLAYPPQTRARMMRILEAEWREWGSRVIDARDRPFEDQDGPVAEQDPAAFSKVLAYWSAVGWEDYILRNKAAFIAGSAAGLCSGDELAGDGRPAIWGCQPWSAAFISFVMRSAGIDRQEFPPSAGHREYVDALILAGDAFGPRATFLAHEVEDYAPVPGDMICADRAARGRAIATLAQRRAELGAGRPMHCDIVMSTAPGEVLAVGGNVAQGVTAVRYRTDAAGRLLRNVRRWFVVFENRIGLARPGA
jgi:hypothetical protein